MQTEKLSAERSLELITEVIAQARKKFEENGFIFMFWGALIAIAAIGQFLLLKNEYYSFHWYPYFLMPIGAIYAMYYFSKKEGHNKHNQISRIVSYAWVFLSINMLVLGFLLGRILIENLIPVILILLAVGTIISGVSVRSRLLLFSGILINLSAFAGFYIPILYQPLLMGIVAIVAVFIPGIILMVQYKRKRHV
jgi:hypothetical protein